MEQRYKPVEVGVIRYITGLYQHSVLERIRRRVERLEKTRMDQCRPWRRHCDPTVVFKNWKNRLKLGGDSCWLTLVLSSIKQDYINTQCWRGYDVELSNLRKPEWINVDLRGDTVIQQLFLKTG
jgi:hypothetical protein